MNTKLRVRIAGDPVTYRLPTPAGGVRLETFVPWTLVKRGAKREVITPLDAPEAFVDRADREHQDPSPEHSALLRALGLAYHWQRLLDEQRATSVAQIAEAEGVGGTQVRRLLRLTLLAPEVVERLVGTPGAVLEQVMRRSWPLVWADQMRGALAGKSRRCGMPTRLNPQDGWRVTARSSCRSCLA
jgi:hypothetical protein